MTIIVYGIFLNQVKYLFNVCCVRSMYDHHLCAYTAWVQSCVTCYRKWYPITLTTVLYKFHSVFNGSFFKLSYSGMQVRLFWTAILLFRVAMERIELGGQRLPLTSPCAFLLCVSCIKTEHLRIKIGPTQLNMKITKLFISYGQAMLYVVYVSWLL